MKEEKREKGDIRSRVIAVIVAFSCCSVGASALLNGEFNLDHSAGNNLILRLEWFGAYVAGSVFLAVGLLAGSTLFRR